MSQTLETFQFSRSDLAPERRLPGISAFMRIRNGADYLEPAICSTMEHVDEIVAVYNQCTDASADILERLVTKFGPDRLRLCHYLPRVHPPGSVEHANEPPDSPHSFVTMSNLALSLTRRRVAMKLDDDHIAMSAGMERIVENVRKRAFRLPEILCFSGINLARDETGKVGVLAGDPLAGAGDHFLFEVTSDTHFIHDPRFEDFDRAGRPRKFADFAYWHVKYMKDGFGFANREVDAGGNTRFERKRARFLARRTIVTPERLAANAPAWARWMADLPLPEKWRLRAHRWRRLRDLTIDRTDLSQWGIDLMEPGLDEPAASLITERQKSPESM